MPGRLIVARGTERRAVPRPAAGSDPFLEAIRRVRSAGEPATKAASVPPGERAAPATPPATPADLRRAALLHGIDIDREVGLEVGPLANPVVPRAPGRLIFYADYTTREALQAQSATNPSVDISLIPEIDYVISPLPERLDRSFDYIVASHVIEHVPDMLGWIVSMFGWLKPGGRLVLAVPDRRYCFDYLRPPSTTGQVMEAFFERRQRPPFSAIYDGMRQAVHFDTPRGWAESPYRGPFEPIFPRSVALATATAARESGNYQDCHCWVFTHESFMEVIGEINELGVAPIRVITDTAPVTRSNEFHVVLAPGA